jgi:hypothetical protein
MLQNRFEYAPGLRKLQEKEPLTKRATEVIRYLHQKSGGTVPVIGVGGIHSPEDVLEEMAAGLNFTSGALAPQQ